MQPIRAAYFAQGRKDGRTIRKVTICDLLDGRRVNVAEYEVETKKAARIVAANYSATPWNF
jgi:hypothetical protein